MRTSTLLAGLLALMLLHIALTALGQKTRHLAGAVHVIQVRQAITGGTARFIQSAIDKATATGAECLIIQLDTPGGLLSSTRDIVQSILNAKVPVVVYISPQGARGASAGTMITLASHVAAMAPATHIGAAHPVSLFGGNDNKIMNEKILNDTSAYVEGIAELRHRNAKWAISAVRESKSITAGKAKAQGVIEIIAENLDDLIEQLNGREVRMDKDTVRTLTTAGRMVIDQEMSFSQNFLTTISNPNLVFFLLALGVLGLYMEFSNPGLILPGVAGAISLIMALIAMQTLPISYGALGLILLGVALLVAESFVPSFGILGFGGLAAMLFGSLFLLDQDQTDLQVSPPMVFITIGTIAVVILVIGRLLLKSFNNPLQSFQSNMEGHTAVVKASIDPRGDGMVLINGEMWKARAGVAIPPGEKVVVEQVDGLVLHVKAVATDAEAEDQNPDAGG
ncbi:MAG: nodulation protein NfeD [SAR324 cluster bacterium]|nr:nodulation protein NfeD [SAR324 cluster bacterium]